MFSLIPSRNNTNINIDLLAKLKDYAKTNFDAILTAYAIAQMAKKSELSKNTKTALFFDDDQNFLLSGKLQPLIDVVEQLNKYAQATSAQNINVMLRNNLAKTVSGFNGKPFVKVSDKYYPPYENGLATPLGFKRNLNTMTDDPVFTPELSANNMTVPAATESPPTAKTATEKNDGDYEQLSKYFLDQKINAAAELFAPTALIKQRQAVTGKIEAWLSSLNNSNNEIFYNKDFIFVDSLEFNYLFNALVTAPQNRLGDFVKNLVLANKINYDYTKNKTNFDLKKYSLETDFAAEKTTMGSSESSVAKDANPDLKTKITDALASVLYGGIYSGSVDNINNGKDFIGGYKIQTSTANGNNESNIASYLMKIKSYWNQAFYSFNDSGFDLGNVTTSEYVRTLYGLD